MNEIYAKIAERLEELAEVKEQADYAIDQGDARYSLFAIERAWKGVKELLDVAYRAGQRLAKKTKFENLASYIEAEQKIIYWASASGVREAAKQWREQAKTIGGGAK